jgi:predicted metal-binding protein
MHELCERCSNKGCKENEELRSSKIDACINIEANPDEDWVFADYYSPDEYEY